MAIIYGLLAKGDGLNGTPFKVRSKKLFKTKELAETYESDFFELCTSEKFLDSADGDTLKISVIEYELIG